MGHTTARRRFGVVLAALAIVALGVSCVPESPSGEPPDPCAPMAVQDGATANVTSNCPPPCPTKAMDGAANVTSNCPPPCPTGTAANLGGGCPEPCPTTPQNGSAANIVDPECPTEPPEECNATTQSGGEGVTTTAHELGQAGPTSFLLEFDALSQPDRFQVYYEGALIHDTGWRGSGTWNDPDGNPIMLSGPGAGSAIVEVPAGASSVITVTVTGQGPGTVWDYLVSCPSAPV